VAGRALVAPFTRTKTRWAEPLRIGAAVVRSDLDERLGLRGTSVFGDGIVFDRAVVNGTRWRLGLEGEWERGPVSLAAEYAALRDQRTGMGLDGGTLPALSTHAWYVSGAWVVTGEEKRGRIEPHRDILQGGLGAVEVAARVERLALSPGTTADQHSRRPAAVAAHGQRRAHLHRRRVVVPAHPHQGARQSDRRGLRRSVPQSGAPAERPADQRVRQPPVRPLDHVMAAVLTRLSRCPVVRAAALAATLLAMTSSAGAQTAEQLFDDSQVTDVHLQLSQRDWDTMHRVDDDTFYAADLTWNDVTVRNVGIRHRGFGTRTLSKPNLLVDFNHYVADQTFLG
jgi:hypothetical protein